MKKKNNPKKLILFFVLVIVAIIATMTKTITNSKIIDTKNNVSQMEEKERVRNEEPQDIEVGQNAIVSSLNIKEKKTGIGQFDSDNEPGNDESADNEIVRSFDSIKYSVNHIMQLKPEEEKDEIQANFQEPRKTNYQGGILEVKAEVPEDCANLVKWDVSKMNWATDAKVSEDGRIFTAKLVMSNEIITVPGVRSIDFMLNVLAAPNGKEIQPTFTSKLIGNEEGEEATLVDEKVIVSAAPSYNIQLTQKAELNYRGHFDTETGEKVENSNENSIFGRMQGYAITLQLYNNKEEKGLKGIELPQGDITFDLTLEEYKGNENVTKEKGYTPILWDYIENEPLRTQGNKGNNIVWSSI